MEKYHQEGYNTNVVEDNHSDRDALMTAVSDYDILWLRGDSETAALYEAKYRPGRISGYTRIEKDGLPKKMSLPLELGIEINRLQTCPYVYPGRCLIPRDKGRTGACMCL